MASFMGFHATVYMAAQAGVVFSAEAMTDSGDHLTYTITNAAKRFWDKGTALTVETSSNGSSWTPTTNYTAQLCGGKITLAAPPGGTNQCRVSGKYLPISQLGQANQWSWSIQRDVLKSTVFGVTWHSKKHGMGDCTAKLSQFYADNFMLTQMAANQQVVLICYEDDTVGTRWEAFAWLKGDAIKHDPTALVAEDVDLEIDGQPYYSAA